MTFLTLTFVYVGAIVILLGLVPWNRAGVSESPFVTTFRTVRIPRASDVMNFVVLTAALSGANANALRGITHDLLPRPHRMGSRQPRSRWSES